jgi:hypothetical protein
VEAVVVDDEEALAAVAHPGERGAPDGADAERADDEDVAGAGLEGEAALAAVRWILVVRS